MLALLHMDFHGSPLVKWLYVAGGFAPALPAVSGGAICWVRPRRAARRAL